MALDPIRETARFMPLEDRMAFDISTERHIQSKINCRGFVTVDPSNNGGRITMTTIYYMCTSFQQKCRHSHGFKPQQLVIVAVK